MEKIYAIRNNVNGFVYIGKTRKPIEKRFLCHLRKLRTNRHDSFILQRDYNEFGEEHFRIELVEEVKDSENVFDVERYWIDKFASKSMCYNVTTRNVKKGYENSWKNNMLLRAFFAAEN